MKKNSYKLLFLLFIILTIFSYEQVANASETTDGFMIGYSKAPITLEVWESFSDPFGERFQSTTKELHKEYGNKINIVYKPFPLEQLFPIDTLAAHASECANIEGFYEEFREYIYSSEGRTDLSNGIIDGGDPKYFGQIGYLKCLDKNPNTYISKYIEEGNDKNIIGVPTTFVINNQNGKEKVVQGAQPLLQVKLIIDEILESQFDNEEDVKNNLSDSEKLDLVANIFGKNSEIYQIVSLLISLGII